MVGNPSFLAAMSNQAISTNPDQGMLERGRALPDKLRLLYDDLTH